MSRPGRAAAAIAGGLLIIAVAAYAVSASSEAASDTASASSTGGETGLIMVAPPPFSEGIFPCSRCHAAMEANRTRRRLTWAHERIELRHDERNRWCLDCHDARDRDVLHLADGRPVPFTESYLLCGQCHGPTLRNWRAGEHGKRTGSWSGEKRYFLCVHCHNPHAPAFVLPASPRLGTREGEPLPPPVRPSNLRREGGNRAGR